MTDTWPPRWTKPQFKTGRTSRVERRIKRAGEKTEEAKNKKKVRLRDKRCRFPMCGCGRLKIAGHVSHSKHKGMGGNPAGDRSSPELMLYLCACRHRENRISIDKGTLRWRELENGRGSDGPVAWDVLTSEVPDRLALVPRKAAHTMTRQRPEWTELWRETAIGVGAPTSGRAASILQWLATMEV